MLIAEMKKENFRFVMDIGIAAGDYTKRFAAVADACGGKQNIPDFIFFSAGLWPAPEPIQNPQANLALLEKDLQSILAGNQKYTALGECGIDRYWNGEAAKKRNNSGTEDTEAEEQLFIEQLIMAKKYKLPVIIHSRDGFEPTIRCIDQVGWHKGVIHCYSYGIQEAQQFIERGWYISFPGNITFAKKEEDRRFIASLVQSIPRHRLLLETDSPYLSPAPLRGKTNTPLHIRHTYAKAAEILQISEPELANLIFENCQTLFERA